MSPLVRLPGVLRDYTGGSTDVAVDAADVDGALETLARRHPLLRRHLFDDAGSLRGHVRVFVNHDDVRELARGGATPLAAGDVILIVPSIAGGAGEAPPRGGDDAMGVGDEAVGAGDEASRAADVAAAFSPAEVQRYARHITLAEVGWSGQQKLRDASVAIVGTGGLGSPIGLYLAAAGVGTLGLIDFDRVDTSNLQRQVLYGTADVGRPKVEAAAQRLRDVNPHIRIVTHGERLTRDNALEVLRRYDVVIDGTDNFPTRYLVNDACVLLGRPYVYGSILRFEGQVSVFDARNGPCYRCLFREPPPPGLVPSCAEGGVLGVLPGIIGSLQALEAIKLIVGAGEGLTGRLVLFDALTLRWRELTLRRNPDCPACGESPTMTGLIDYDEFCGIGESAMELPQQTGAVPQMTVTELKERLDRGDPLVLVDVRERFEWEIGNLGAYGAQLIPLDEVVERRREIDPGAEVVVYCRSGSRSAGAVRQLRSHGYGRIWNLKGGINAWAQQVDPTLQAY